MSSARISSGASATAWRTWSRSRHCSPCRGARSSASPCRRDPQRPDDIARGLDPLARGISLADALEELARRAPVPVTLDIEPVELGDALRGCSGSRVPRRSRTPPSTRPEQASGSRSTAPCVSRSRTTARRRQPAGLGPPRPDRPRRGPRRHVRRRQPGGRWHARGRHAPASWLPARPDSGYHAVGGCSANLALQPCLRHACTDPSRSSPCSPCPRSPAPPAVPSLRPRPAVNIAPVILDATSYGQQGRAAYDQLVEFAKQVDTLSGGAMTVKIGRPARQLPPRHQRGGDRHGARRPCRGRRGLVAHVRPARCQQPSGAPGAVP